MKITSKEEARKLADKDILFFVHKGKFKRLEVTDNSYIVHSETGKNEFPFTDLKNGDLCVVKGDDGDIEATFHVDGEYWAGYCDREFTGKYVDVTFITKTGFNILEHLEGEKS